MISEFLQTSETFYMPYAPGAGYGNRNNGYINITAEPDRYNEIKEVIGFPELGVIIRQLQPAEHSLTTLRSDSCLDEHVLPDLNHSCYAMVTIAFRVPHPNDLHWFKWFHKDFVEFPKYKKISDRVTVIFKSVPLVHKGHNFRGSCLDIVVVGNGLTASDARGKWISGMRALSQSLDRWDIQVKKKLMESAGI